MYIITGSIVFTSVDIPFWSLPAAMTSNTKERSEIVGFTTTASNTITGIIGLVMPMALAFLANLTGMFTFFLALAVAVWGCDHVPDFLQVGTGACGTRRQ